MEIVKQPPKLCKVTMYELMVKNVKADLIEDKLKCLGKSQWIEERKNLSQKGIHLNQLKTSSSLWYFVWWCNTSSTESEA